ncbi:MAG TPA: hypothetical protein VGX46_16810 [Vicinamibacterales bacterium]|jgi:hypothetical protein|nr:hypothetical protein [Vicinamibacterales bacterium]
MVTMRGGAVCDVLTVIATDIARMTAFIIVAILSSAVGQAASISSADTSVYTRRVFRPRRCAASFRSYRTRFVGEQTLRKELADLCQDNEELLGTERADFLEDEGCFEHRVRRCPNDAAIDRYELEFTNSRMSN